MTALFATMTNFCKVLEVGFVGVGEIGHVVLCRSKDLYWESSHFKASKHKGQTGQVPVRLAQ